MNINSWWFQPTPLKNMTSSVWDDEIPNINGQIIQMFQTTNQQNALHEMPTSFDRGVTHPRLRVSDRMFSANLVRSNTTLHLTK